MNTNGQKQEKKPTNAQLERRLATAVLHIDRDKDTKSIFFDDKGLRITVTDDYAIIGTSAHQHVFSAITLSGYSRPYLYTKRLLEIALDNDCTHKDERGNVSYSYTKLFAILHAKEDKLEYNLCWYIDLWLSNIFTPLFDIDETEANSFIVYEQYVHNMARMQAILKEKTEDMTNLQYIDEVLTSERKFVEGLQESVIFKKKTDVERKQEEIDALGDALAERTMEEQKKDNGKEQ